MPDGDILLKYYVKTLRFHVNDVLLVFVLLTLNNFVRIV